MTRWHFYFHIYPLITHLSVLLNWHNFGILIQRINNFFLKSIRNE